MGFRALALLGVLALSLPALADTVELEPDQDNSIYEEGGLSNGAGERLFVGTTLFGTARRALVRFAGRWGNICAGLCLRRSDSTAVCPLGRALLSSPRGSAR